MQDDRLSNLRAEASQRMADRNSALEAIGWISIDDRLPDMEQEVTVLMTHGQIRQVVRSNYTSGFKQPNCTGWECLSLAKMEHTITHWRPEVHPRLPEDGPSDAPWKRSNAR